MSYEARETQGKFGSKFHIYELRETETDSSFQICPERGGMVISYAPHGQELLYLDDHTFANLDMNVRGGIPVLWPICGQLQNGKYEWDGNMYEMANHGLARRFAWSIVSVDTGGRAAITLKFTSNDKTKREFPFEFELVFTYELVGGRLNIHQTYTNKSSTPMPMYAGFHPYFLTESKQVHCETDATAYFDYNDGSEHEFNGLIDLENRVESVALQGARHPKISFEAEAASRTGSNSSRTVHMEYGSEFKYVVLWTVQGKPFICIEPWMALTGSLASKRELTLVTPGESLDTFVSIWESADV